MQKIILLLLFPGIFIFKSFPQKIVPDLGLVAYYPFNGNTLDSTGNNHHSTSNGVSFTTGRFGQANHAAYFTGQSNTLAFKGYQMDGPNSTIAFWVKPNADTDTVFFNIFPKSIKIVIRVVDNRYRLEIAVSVYKFILQDSSVMKDPASPGYDFIAVIFNTNTIRFYVNSGYTDYYISPEIMTVSYYFPRPIINTPVYYFKGKVDDARIYSRSLNSLELTSLYSERDKSLPVCAIDSIFNAGFDYTRVFSSIKDDGGAEIIDKGICWSTTPVPDTSNFVKRYYNDILELVPNTTYYVRAFAENEVGIAYSNEVNFTTPFAEVDTIFDIDGNLYKTVKIGSQTWMAGNLRTTRYANGEPIKYGHDSIPFVKGKYYFFIPQMQYLGYYYTWMAATNTDTFYNTYPNGVQGACPNGWHIPTRNDFTVLTEYLGGPEIGNKLKARGDNSGHDYWTYNYSEEINQSFFNAQGDGYRYNPEGINYMFEDYLNGGYLWTSESRPPVPTPGPELYYYSSYFFLISLYSGHTIYYTESFNGYAVRCIKDTTSIHAKNNSKKPAPVSYAVYPNPASEVLYLTNTPEKVTVTIYDTQSRVRLKTNVTDGKVNIASLPKGIYFIHISDGVTTQKKKFVK